MDDDFVMLLIMVALVVIFTVCIMFTPMTCAFCHKHKCLYRIERFSFGGVQYNVCNECRDNLMIERINKEDSK